MRLGKRHNNHHRRQARAAISSIRTPRGMRPSLFSRQEAPLAAVYRHYRCDETLDLVRIMRAGGDADCPSIRSERGLRDSSDHVREQKKREAPRIRLGAHRSVIDYERRRRA